MKTKIIIYLQTFKLQLIIIVLTLSLLSLFVHWQNATYKIKTQSILIDSLKNQIHIKDSTSDDLYWKYFNESLENGRQEETRSEILDKYPKIKKEYYNFYLNQTE